MAYVDHAGSQLIVAQKGIDDVLLAQSAFPEATMAQVSRLPGVASVDSIVDINGAVSVRGPKSYLTTDSPGSPAST